MSGELRFKIGSFVFMDHVLLCQFIQHRSNFGKRFFSNCFICFVAKLAKNRTGRFGLVTVYKALGVVRADTFDRRFMICHLSFNYF